MVVGCQSDSTNQRLIVSHTWEGEDAEVLEGILNNFAEDNPNLTLTIEQAGENGAANFQLQAEAGLGADVFIGLNDPDMVGLYKAGLTIDLADLVETELFDQRLRGNVQLDEALVGVPFSATTSLVYYDSQLIETPPQTLDDLFTIADAGQMVAINIDPLVSLWGIRAFGGQLYDETGQVAINDNDAYEQWLEWLQNASRHANIVLSDDYDTLLAQFSTAEFGVLVGSSADYPDLITAMGADTVGVTTLPEGAGSVIVIESMVVNRASANIDLAIELIQFLLNDAQQRTLAVADISHTAVNLDETLDNRMFAYASTVQALVLLSEPLPLDSGPTTGSVIETTHLLTHQVLDGIIDPAEAPDLLMNAIDEPLDPPQ